MMVVVKIELWPHGDESKSRPLGVLMIANDGTGDERTGNYHVEASHSGKYLGKRTEPYKSGKVMGFSRSESVYRLLSRALRAINET